MFSLNVVGKYAPTNSWRKVLCEILHNSYNQNLRLISAEWPLSQSECPKKTVILKMRKRCDFSFWARQKKRYDFLTLAIFLQYFCEIYSKTCDFKSFALCELKPQRFFCDCDFWVRGPNKYHLRQGSHSGLLRCWLCDVPICPRLGRVGQGQHLYRQQRHQIAHVRCVQMAGSGKLNLRTSTGWKAFFQNVWPHGPYGFLEKSQRRRDDNKNIIFAFWGGGGLGGQRGKTSKTLFFVGNATTINFESANFIVEKFCCHCAGS